MVTEEQRLHLLNILALAPAHMPQILTELKKQGIDATEEDIRNATEQLKKVRGV